MVVTSVQLLARKEEGKDGRVGKREEGRRGRRSDGDGGKKERGGGGEVWIEERRRGDGGGRERYRIREMNKMVGREEKWE